MATKVTNLTLAYQTGADNLLYASWNFSKSNLDHYEVKWTYWTGDNVEFTGESSDVEDKNATYSPPDNAGSVRVKVTPVSKTYTSNGKTKSYWTGTAVTAKITTTWSTPPTLSAPTVTLDGYKLTASLDNIDTTHLTHVEFYVLRDNTTKQTSGTAKVSWWYASKTCTVSAGHKYKVCCRGVNTATGVTANKYGEWSDWSSEVETIPSAVSGVSCAADTETSVKVTWDENTTADSYEVEYTTNQSYFDSSSEVSSQTSTTTYAYITGLDEGETWYFRVRAVNDEGESEWSDIVSTVLGSDPEAPTTWSSTTTAIVGESVYLYWVHNAEDGSDQVSAEIELTIDGTTSTVTVDTSEDDQDVTSFYALDLSSYTAGAEILWRVRTMGVTGVYGDWSIQRTIHLYAPPVLTLEATELLESLPLSIAAEAEPTTQTPTGYYISITAENAYETVDITGTTVQVKAGGEVYSKYVNTSDNPLDLDISAGDITLENGQSYQLTVTVSMDSGLTAEESTTFEVSWSDEEYDPTAGIAVDTDSLVCYISPYCEDDDENLIEGVTLSVYRREFDGTLTELITGLENTGSNSITDPHPALDYARYRIVAIDSSTGAVSYNDLPGEPINEHAIVMQWDEDWSEFDYDEETEPVEPPWTGSMVRLPYNVDVSESNELDVSLVEYIGREHPVSYYGTQIGTSASWSCEIEKSDTETIYALRRLARWMGDVYVREPSGTGYWAQVSVSMNLNHCELTVPVSFEVKRVEGGA